jgi:hypothetical protein
MGSRSVTGKHEEVVMWHHFPTASRQSALNKNIPSLRNLYFKLGLNLASEK